MNPLTEASEKNLCFCENNVETKKRKNKVMCEKNESILLILKEENWFDLLNYLLDKQNATFAGWVRLLVG